MSVNGSTDTLYINIGTEKSCMFVKMSRYLLRQLERYPLLYYSVEEALECAKIGYYGIGAIAFAQLLNLLNEKTPESRHLVAHRFLEVRPSKETFDEVVAEFKAAAANRSDHESRSFTPVGEYHRTIAAQWNEFIKNLHATPQSSQSG
jgi:hypothetical protein